MLTILGPKGGGFCDGVSRRGFLRIGRVDASGGAETIDRYVHAGGRDTGLLGGTGSEAELSGVGRRVSTRGSTFRGGVGRSTVRSGGVIALRCRISSSGRQIGRLIRLRIRGV